MGPPAFTLPRVGGGAPSATSRATVATEARTILRDGPQPLSHSLPAALRFAVLDRVPNEIVALIIEAAAAQAKQRTRETAVPIKFADSDSVPDRDLEHNVVLTLHSIDRRFRSISARLPGIWTTVTDSMPAELVTMFLKMSRDCPLTVVIRWMHEDNEGLVIFLREVLLQRHRWQTLLVALPEGHMDDPRIAGMQDRTFPQLQEVAVLDDQSAHGSRLGLRMDDDLFLARWAVPALTSAFCSNTIPCGPAFGSLRSLTIRLCGFYTEPPDLWKPLSGCTSLITLRVTVHDWHPWGINTWARHASRQVPLVSTTVETLALALDAVAYCSADRLFRAFAFPRLTELNVSVTRSQDAPLEAWTSSIFGPAAVGGAETLEHITLDLTDITAEKGMRLPTVPEFLFNSPKHASLRRLTMRQSSLGLGVPWAPFVSRIYAFDHFPRSLEVLDITEVEFVSHECLVLLIQRLCAANSSATLRVAEDSLCNEFAQSKQESPLRFVQAFCASEQGKGRVAFPIVWLPSSARPLCCPWDWRSAL